MSDHSRSPLVDASRAGDAGAGAARVQPRNQSTPAERRKAFRERVGVPENGTVPVKVAKALQRRKEQPTRPPLRIDKAPPTTFRDLVKKAYDRQNRYYYIMAGASHGFLWLQIGIGATLTALGTTNSNAARIAITVLGAVNTVIAGFLTFLKSRNQPNRALQFRNGLRGVYEDIWQADSETGRDDFDVDKKAEDLWGKYKEAVQESEANYPDLWVSLNKLVKSQDVDKNPPTQMRQTHVPQDDTTGNRTSESHQPLLR